MKFGFEKYGDWFILKSCLFTQINISLKHSKITIGQNEEYEIENFKFFVHQLQNLYFALTGEELVLKELV